MSCASEQVLTVKARVAQRTVYGRKQDGLIGRKSAVLVLHLQSVDGRATNSRAYIDYSTVLARLKPEVGDKISFKGRARKVDGMFHFTHLKKVSVEKPERGSQVSGVLEPGQSLHEYVQKLRGDNL